MALEDFFVWGKGGSKLTPDQLEQRRQVEEALLAKGVDTSPVGHWTQGLARVANAAAGSFRRGQLERDEEENATYNSDIINSLLGGGSSSAASSMPATTGAGAELAATSPAVAGSPEAYRNAIASIESAGSGDYSAVGPTNPKLGRALGRYQIMEANIGPWSQEALGRPVTADEFLADPKLQDAIFDKKFGSYVQQYGPEGAAQAWFAGPGGVGKTDRSDVLGTTVGEYASKFRNALGPEVAASTPEAAIEAVAPASGYVDPQVSAAPALPAPVEVAPAPAVAEAPQQQIAQALTAPAAAPAATGINPAILRALSDPRATPQTQRIAAMLLQQEQQKQQMAEEQRLQAADPLRQIQLQREQLELDQLRQPKQQPLVNLGNGTAYDPNNKSFIQAPGGGQQFRKATAEEAQQYGAAAGQFGPDGRFYAENPPQGTALSVGPNGEITFNQGAGVKPLTEAQSKDTLYATRATNALPLVDKYESELLSLSGNLAEGIPLNLGNYAQSEQYQVARDAGRDFLATILRKDTGAAITSNEEAIYGKMFLPQPGDKPAAIQAKRQRRALAVEAIKAGMPTAAIENMAKALETVPPSKGGEAISDPPRTEKPISEMTDEELEALANGN